MAHYDVFISCKSEDYELAEEVYRFLEENQIRVFLATKELRKLGESDYREAIEDAIENAKHLIVLASQVEYIKSKWVKYEWGLFLNAKIDGYKEGNIVTILKGISPKQIAFALRRYESFEFSRFRETLLSYVETEDSRERLKRIEDEKKREAERHRQQEAELQRQKEIRANLIGLAEQYKKDSVALSLIIAKIKSNKREVGNDSYLCPVCGSKSSIDEEMCPSCGWIFSPVEGIEGADYLLDETRKRAKRYAAIYTKLLPLPKNNARTDEMSSLISKLKTENRQLVDDVNIREQKLNEYRRNVLDLRNEIKHLTAVKTSEISELKSHLNAQDLKIKYLTKQLESAKSDSENNKRQRTESKSNEKVKTQCMYYVWVTFSTIASSDIIREYNPDYARIGGKTNICVSGFNSRKEAEDLLVRLGQKGATAHIKEVPLNEKPDDNTGNGSSGATTDNRFGVTIWDTKGLLSSISKVLSDVYEEPVKTFADKLTNLPYITQPILSRLAAQQLLESLSSMGAAVNIFELQK